MSEDVFVVQFPAASIEPRVNYVYLDQETLCLNQEVKCSGLPGNGNIEEMTLNWEVIRSGSDGMFILIL